MQTQNVDILINEADQLLNSAMEELQFAGLDPDFPVVGYPCPDFRGAGVAGLPKGCGLQEEIWPTWRHQVFSGRQDRRHRAADEEAHGNRR